MEVEAAIENSHRKYAVGRGSTSLFSKDSGVTVARVGGDRVGREASPCGAQVGELATRIGQGLPLLATR